MAPVLPSPRRLSRVALVATQTTQDPSHCDRTTLIDHVTGNITPHQLDVDPRPTHFSPRKGIGVAEDTLVGSLPSITQLPLPRAGPTLAPDPSPPITPSTTLTSLPTYEESQLECHWSNHDSGHKVLAVGEVMYDWDGFIPERKTRGLRTKRGRIVEICGFVNDDWVMVHDETCKYLPRLFVRIVSFDPSATTSKQPSRHLSIYQKIATFCIHSRKHLFLRWRNRYHNLNLAQGVDNWLNKPAIPPAPFPREPSDQDHNGHRVIVDANYETPFEIGESIVTFAFTLGPRPHSRFTSLQFDVELPKQRKVQAEAANGAKLGSNSAKQNALLGAQGGGLHPLASYADAGVRVTLEETPPQSVTWMAIEPNESSFGLGHKLSFSVRLPTGTHLRDLRCHYKLRLGNQHKIGMSDTHEFSHHWNMDHTPGPSASKRTKLLRARIH